MTPAGVERDYDLSRLTTVRTGGRADYFAAAGHVEGLVELLAWAKEEGIEVGVVGSGSNLLVADEGFDGLVLKLDRQLASSPTPVLGFVVTAAGDEEGYGYGYGSYHARPYEQSEKAAVAR